MVVNNQPLHRLTGCEYLRLIGEDIKNAIFQGFVLFCGWMGVQGFERLSYYAVVNNWDHEELNIFSKENDIHIFCLSNKPC